MSASARERLHARATLLILLVVALGLIGTAWATQRAFEKRLTPQLMDKAQTMGVSTSGLISRALHYGFGLTELEGVEESFNTLRRKHPELGWIAVRDAQGRLVFHSGEEVAGSPRVSLPIPTEGTATGSLELAPDPAFLSRLLRESLLDILAMLGVALFLTRELLAYITGPRFYAAQAHAGLLRLRAPLFAFMLAEELTRPFLPLHARALYQSWPGWSADVAVGLPIVAFMLIVALGQPVLGVLAERLGHRRTMQLGALWAIIGLALSGLAASLAELIAWRALCGLGYAMVFVAAQAHVLTHTTPRERSRGFALFVGAITVAGICGPPIGGILAEHLGARWSFVVAAALAVVALGAISTLPKQTEAPPAAERAPRVSDFLHLLRDRQFLAVSVFAAVPAKLILAGFCFYLVPLYANALGASPSAAGRALMVYAVSLVLVLPQATRMAERGLRNDYLVLAGLVVSGAGGLLILLPGGGLAPVFAAMLLLGAGQGLSIAAQSSLVGELCAPAIRRYGNGAVYGVYRLVERLGNTLGPLLAGALVAWLGYRDAFAWIGALVWLSALCFALAGGVLRPRQAQVEG